MMADVLKVQRNPPPYKHRDHRPIPTLSVAGHDLRMPHDSIKCARAVEDALLGHKPVAAPDEECRSVMLKALEIQRNAPPPHRLPRPPAVEMKEAPPPQPGTPGAPYQSAAEEAAAAEAAPEEPAAENAAPPGSLVPHSPLLHLVPNVPQNGE